jgi:hypothetical protein
MARIEVEPGAITRGARRPWAGAGGAAAEAFVGSGGALAGARPDAAAGGAEAEAGGEAEAEAGGEAEADREADARGEVEAGGEGAFRRDLPCGRGVTDPPPGDRSPDLALRVSPPAPSGLVGLDRMATELVA